MARTHEREVSDEVVEALTREFLYANPMQVPTVNKIVINIGLGEAVANPKALDAATRDLSIMPDRSR